MQFLVKTCGIISHYHINLKHMLVNYGNIRSLFHCRLIVVAEKQTVYKKFPIPLINRLEKHFLTINTMLKPEQQIVVRKLEEWAQDFVTQKQSLTGYRYIVYLIISIVRALIYHLKSLKLSSG